MKKIVMAALLLTALRGTAFAQNASDFTVNANGVITKYTGFDTVVVIPATIGGRKITAIGYEAFRKADLTSVTIPEGVTEIGDYAFRDNKLTRIAIPNSVTSIGVEAFANNRLTNVTIPGSVKVIQNNAFRGNTTLATIVISEGVEEIWPGAFADTKCTSVNLPSTITGIGSNSFDISGKPSLTLAANINNAGSGFVDFPAFYSYIANDRKAGTYAFNLPLTSKKADDYEYYETRYGAVLTKYTGDSTRVRIPATIGGVAVKALYGTLNNSRNNFDRFIVLTSKIVAVQIPEGITYIGRFTFAGNELANITIPDSVTYIGSYAFNSNQLTSVTISNSVKYIGVGAFEDNKLTSIIIPDSVTYIGYNAFTKGSGIIKQPQLTSVTIGSNVELGSNVTSYSREGPFDSISFNNIYNANNKAAGTYIYTNDNWTKLTVPFPAGFVGTWKRDNYNNTLTFSANFFTDSAQTGSAAYLVRVSGDSYTCAWASNGREFTLTFRLVNGNLVISGDSGDGEKNWNGTWKKIN